MAGEAKVIPELGPDGKSQEQFDRIDIHKSAFERKYATHMRSKGVDSEIIGKIGGYFESNGGNIGKAINSYIVSLEIHGMDKAKLDELKSLLHEFIDTSKLSLSEPERIQEDAIVKLQEIPEFYILQKLAEKGQVDQEKYKQLLESATGNFESLRNRVLGIIGESKDEKVKQDIKTMILGREITEENFDESKFAKEVGPLNKETKNKNDFNFFLAENYISFDIQGEKVEGDTKKITEENFKITLNICLQKTLNSAHSDFEKQNSDLILKIQSETDVHKKYSYLKDLFTKKNTSVGAAKSKEKNNTELKDKKVKRINEIIGQVEKSGDITVKIGTILARIPTYLEKLQEEGKITPENADKIASKVKEAKELLYKSQIGKVKEKLVEISSMLPEGLTPISKV